jgi:hypothetical protein
VGRGYPGWFLENAENERLTGEGVKKIPEDAEGCAEKKRLVPLAGFGFKEELEKD